MVGEDGAQPGQQQSLTTRLESGKNTNHAEKDQQTGQTEVDFRSDISGWGNRPEILLINIPIASRTIAKPPVAFF